MRNDYEQRRADRRALIEEKRRALAGTAIGGSSAGTTTTTAPPSGSAATEYEERRRRREADIRAKRGEIERLQAAIAERRERKAAATKERDAPVVPMPARDVRALVTSAYAAAPASAYESPLRAARAAQSPHSSFVSPAPKTKEDVLATLGRYRRSGTPTARAVATSRAAVSSSSPSASTTVVPTDWSRLAQSYDNISDAIVRTWSAPSRAEREPQLSASPQHPRSHGSDGGFSSKLGEAPTTRASMPARFGAARGGGGEFEFDVAAAASSSAAPRRSWGGERWGGLSNKVPDSPPPPRSHQRPSAKWDDDDAPSVRASMPVGPSQRQRGARGGGESDAVRRSWAGPASVNARAAATAPSTAAAPSPVASTKEEDADDGYTEFIEENVVVVEEALVTAAAAAPLESASPQRLALRPRGASSKWAEEEEEGGDRAVPSVRASMPAAFASASRTTPNGSNDRDVVTRSWSGGIGAATREEPIVTVASTKAGESPLLQSRSGGRGSRSSTPRSQLDSSSPSQSLQASSKWESPSLSPVASHAERAGASSGNSGGVGTPSRSGGASTPPSRETSSPRREVEATVVKIERPVEEEEEERLAVSYTVPRLDLTHDEVMASSAAALESDDDEQSATLLRDFDAELDAAAEESRATVFVNAAEVLPEDLPEDLPEEQLSEELPAYAEEEDGLSETEGSPTRFHAVYAAATQAAPSSYPPHGVSREQVKPQPQPQPQSSLETQRVARALERIAPIQTSRLGIQAYGEEEHYSPSVAALDRSKRFGNASQSIRSPCSKKIQQELLHRRRRIEAERRRAADDRAAARRRIGEEALQQLFEERRMESAVLGGGGDDARFGGGPSSSTIRAAATDSRGTLRDDAEQRDAWASSSSLGRGYDDDGGGSGNAGGGDGRDMEGLAMEVTSVPSPMAQRGFEEALSPAAAESPRRAPVVLSFKKHEVRDRESLYLFS